MTIDENNANLKRLFGNYELDLPYTDSLDILASTISMLEELKEKRKMLDFLSNVINPNDMEVYMRMYNSTDTKECVNNDD